MERASAALELWAIFAWGAWGLMGAAGMSVIAGFAAWIVGRSALARLLLACAGLLAGLVHIHRRYRDAGYLADHDPVTDLFNHRAMFRGLEKAVVAPGPEEELFCVAMIDLDHFKHYNDSLGHAAGDDALSHVAEILKEHGRQTDLFGRYGSDEFIGLLWECDRQGAESLFFRVTESLVAEWNPRMGLSY